MAIDSSLIQLSFTIKGEEFKVISQDNKSSLKKELDLLFEKEIGKFSALDDADYIFQKYNNVTIAKGDLKRGDIVFSKAFNGKKSSFMVQSPFKDNDEGRVFFLKPLYKSKYFSQTALEKKHNPLFLDITYSLGFMNSFRNLLKVDVKNGFLYPLFIKAGVQNEINLSFEGRFISEAFGLNIGLECLVPLDYIFSTSLSLHLYSDFNLNFIENISLNYFYVIPDVSIGLEWFINPYTAIKFAAKFSRITTYYTLYVPHVVLGTTIII